MRDRKHILVVDDERDLAELLVYNLQQNGYESTAVFDGRAALAAAAQEPPDAVILDLLLPEIPGLEVAQRLRSDPATAQIPILMLTAKGSETDQVEGLEAGADDYVTKPFSIKVLLARLDAVLRRASAAANAGGVLQFGDVVLNTDTHDAIVDNAPVRLTLTEFRLLAALVRAGGRVMSRTNLIAKAIGPGITVTERTIDVHVASIRKKLGDSGLMVRTVRGVGYRIVPESEVERPTGR